MDSLIELASPAVRAWILTASQDEILTAIELGMPAVNRIRAIKVPTIVQYSGQALATLPVTRGQIGESHVEDILRKRFGAVTNVAHVSKSGDLTLQVDCYKVTVEVKNYSGAVGHAQLDKFHRDLSVTGAAAGLFISLKSPISGIGPNFVMRFTTIGSRVVPCAYLVSSDEAVIVTAVNMVAQLLSSCDYLNSELHSKDKLLAAVEELTGQLGLLSRARVTHQADIGDIMTRLAKTSADIAGAEVTMRRIINGINSDLFQKVITMGGVEHELENLPSFAKYSQMTQSMIMDMMSAQGGSGKLSDVTWKTTAKKCVNCATGIGFNFLAQGPSLFMPRSQMSVDTMMGALNAFKGRVTITDELFSIDLDAITCEWVKNIIIGVNQVDPPQSF